MPWTWNHVVSYALAAKVVDKILEIVLAEQPELITRAVKELLSNAEVQEEDNKPDDL